MRTLQWNLIRAAAWVLLLSAFSSLVHAACCAPVSPASVKTAPKQRLLDIVVFVSIEDVTAQNHTSFLRHARISRSKSLHVPKNFKKLCWGVKRLTRFGFLCGWSRRNVQRASYLCVALPQTANQFITLVRVQVRWKVRVHAELRT